MGNHYTSFMLNDKHCSITHVNTSGAYTKTAYP